MKEEITKLMMLCVAEHNALHAEHSSDRQALSKRHCSWLWEARELAVGNSLCPKTFADNGLWMRTTAQMHNDSLR